MACFRRGAAGLKCHEKTKGRSRVFSSPSGAWREADDGMAVAGQRGGQMGADEAGSAGDQDA
jgi:hypothetical protein